MLPFSASALYRPRMNTSVSPKVGRAAPAPSPAPSPSFALGPPLLAYESRCRQRGSPGGPAPRSEFSLILRLVAPDTGIDSIHGNAIVTPRPRNIVRRESGAGSCGLSRLILLSPASCPGWGEIVLIVFFVLCACSEHGVMDPTAIYSSYAQSRPRISRNWRLLTMVSIAAPTW